MNYIIDNIGIFRDYDKILYHNKVKTAFLIYLIYKRKDIFRNLYYFRNYVTYKSLKEHARSCFYTLLFKIPHYKKLADKEVNNFNSKLESEFQNNQLSLTTHFNDKLAHDGYTINEIKTKLLNLKSNNKVNKELVSGTIYNNNDEEVKMIQSILPIYYKSNPLHPDIFPEISLLEKNIINVTKKLFSGDDKVCGCVTSGGTESILLACYSYKNLGLQKGIEHPEIILPITAHAAFDKAANYFGIKLHKIPVDYKTNRIDFTFVYNSINNRTIALVCSTPSFAHGLLDPVSYFSQIAVDYKIPLHVDACLGGFILPFIDTKSMNYQFGFDLPGVTSISADTHKYGYTPKGSSILLYRNEKHFKNQIFVETDWNGGIYATPTIVGSRPGNNIVFTWAILNYYGFKKYKENSEKIVHTTKTISNALKTVNDIYLFGEPQLNVIGIGSDKHNIYTLNKYMTMKGWNLNELQLPASIHLCVTLNHCNKDTIEKFISDIKYCVNKLNNEFDNKDENKLDNDKAEEASIYGSTQKIPDRRLIKDVAKHFIKQLSN